MPKPSASEAAHRADRRPRRWLLWLVLPLVALGALHAGWTLSLHWRFDARIEALRAAGAPVRFADLEPEPVAERRNAAPLLAEADRWYERHLLPGEAVYTDFYWDEVPELDAEALRKREADLRALRQWLARGDPYVRLLARAAARDRLRPELDWEAGLTMPDPTAVWIRRAVVYLGERSVRAERASRDRLEELAVLLDLARTIEPYVSIHVAMRWATESRAADALEALARKPGFEARTARELLDGRLRACLDDAVLRTGLVGERAVFLEFCRRWIGGESPTRMLIGIEAIVAPDAGGSGEPAEGWMHSDAVLGSWPARPLAYRDALRVLDLSERALALVDLPAREALAGARALGEAYRTGIPNFASHLLAAVPEGIMRKRIRHRATVRVTRVGLALMELHDATGAWPATLDAVEPVVGSAALEDPFTGQRLRYVPGEGIEAAAPVPHELLRDQYEIAWRFGGDSASPAVRDPR